MNARWRPSPVRYGSREDFNAQPDLGQVIKRLDLSQVPVRVAVLGVAEDGHPMLVRLGPLAQHIVILGDTRDGRGELLRSLVMSLALLTPQRRAQMAVIDATGALDCLAALPHLLTPLVGDPAGAIELLDYLLAVAKQADAEREPHVAVVISELDRWDDPLMERVVELGRLGTGAGIHLISSFAEADGVSGELWQRGQVLRLVGRSGQFEAITGDEVWPFTAATLVPAEARRLAEALWQQPGRTLMTSRVGSRRRLRVVS